MYGEALRNGGIFLVCLSAAAGAAAAAAYVLTGRRLRARLEAEYGKVCALPRAAGETPRAVEARSEADEAETPENSNAVM